MLPVDVFFIENYNKSERLINFIEPLQNYD